MRSGIYTNILQINFSSTFIETKENITKSNAGQYVGYFGADSWFLSNWKCYNLELLPRNINGKTRTLVSTFHDKNFYFTNQNTENDSVCYSLKPFSPTGVNQTL